MDKVDKLMNVLFIVSILAVLAISASAFRNLNDGRVTTVVKQLVSPHLNEASAAVSRE